MRYLRVEWRHDHADEPIVLYSELDESSWERRKVEVYRDGRMGFADGQDSLDSTRLGLLPVPSSEELASSSEFAPQEITKDEFDRIWNQAQVVLRA